MRDPPLKLDFEKGVGERRQDKTAWRLAKTDEAMKSMRNDCKEGILWK